MGSAGLIAAVALPLLVAPQTAPRVGEPQDQGPRGTAQADRIYGRVLTDDGEVLEGYLRWDRNEGSWADFLDGAKELPWEHLREAERLDEDYARRRALERSITVGGLRISWDEDPEDEMQTSASGVRFGHLRSLVAIDDRRARLLLKSGRELDLVREGTDLGRSFRGLAVDLPADEPVELRWRDLDRVDFKAVPAGAPAPAASRLHGTLRTGGGLELTGFVAWDLDEILTSDVLDGEATGQDYSIPFARIAAVHRESRSAARVILTSGEELVLRDTNDVDATNRGIEISDPSLGRALVDWDDFETVRFHPPAGSLAAYGAFDGGRALRGTVETRNGNVLVGEIRWDNDEAFTWETLDGVSHGVAFAVELGNVRSIVRAGERRVEVTLHDGRVLDLAGSSDVDRENRGIFVTPEGGWTALVRWRDLHSLIIEP